MGAGMLVFWLMPDVLLSIFNASADMLKIGVPGLRIISLCFLPAALGIVGSTFFQAVGKGVNSLLVSLLRQLIVLLPAAFLLAKLGVVEWVWYCLLYTSRDKLYGVPSNEGGNPGLRNDPGHLS